MVLICARNVARYDNNDNNDNNAGSMTAMRAMRAVSVSHLITLTTLSPRTYRKFAVLPTSNKSFRSSFRAIKNKQEFEYTDKCYKEERKSKSSRPRVASILTLNVIRLSNELQQMKCVAVYMNGLTLRFRKFLDYNWLDISHQACHWSLTPSHGIRLSD